MVMSRKWWRHVYEHSSDIDYTLPDDVAISELLKPFSIFTTVLPRWDAGSPSLPLSGIFHMRCKGNDDPSQTVRVMRELIPIVYPCLSKYHQSVHTRSDIFEHLPTIMRYARECERVLDCSSTLSHAVWAFLYGLSQSGRPTRELLANYSRANVNDIQQVARSAMTARVSWRASFLPSCLDVREVRESIDLTFIDTWHIYAQLIRELEKFAPVTKKYIIIHDTTVDEWQGETIRNGWNAEEQAARTGFPVEDIRRGLWPAITDFLSAHPEWSVTERHTNCNGLTVLKRENDYT